MKGLRSLTFWLLVIGGLNWLFVGLWDMDVVMKLGASAAKVVYILVGLSAIHQAFAGGRRDM